MFSINRLQRLILRELTQMRVQCIDYRVCVRHCRWWVGKDTYYNGSLSSVFTISILESVRTQMLMGVWGLGEAVV